ncbi:ubiquinone biosynthesis protein UbiB, partial [Candidatus Woesearchaeota archaeon]|nr:ubiquinone biosynthesis protein UbiB [Candidatus Woesearchaeota archaeon]
SSNRMTYGVLIAALLITGALLKDVGKPMYGGFPLFSLGLFGIAVLLALFLTISIFHEGRGGD